MNKRFLIALCFAFALTLVSTPALAADEAETTATDAASAEVVTTDTDVTVAADEETAETAEEVSAQELGVAEPTVLPGSFFYPFKRFAERVQETFTFDPQKKAELEQRLANKRLVEARRLAQDGKAEEAAQVLEDYRAKMEAAQDRLSQIDRESLTPEQQERLDAVSDRVTANLLKQQRVLERVEDRVPEEAKERIRTNIAAAQERIEERLSRLPVERQEEVKARIEGILEQLPGDDVTRAEYLERLKQVRTEVVPAEITARIQERATEQQARIEAAVAEGKIDATAAAERLEMVKERTEKTIEAVNIRAEQLKENIDFRIDTEKQLNDLRDQAQQATTEEGRAEIREQAQELKDHTQEELKSRAEEIRNTIRDSLPPRKTAPTPVR